MSLTPEELGQKIRDAAERQAKANPKPAATEGKKAPPGAGRALRASTDLVAGLVVGTFLGYWIDHWLGTKPFGMIVFFFLGFGAGFMNIYRAQMGQDYKIGFKEAKGKDKE